MPLQPKTETDTQAGQCQNCHCDSKQNDRPTRYMLGLCIAAVNFLYMRRSAGSDGFGRKTVIECLHSRPWWHLRHTLDLSHRYGSRLTSRSTCSPRYSGAELSGSGSGALAAASSTIVSTADEADIMSVSAGRILQGPLLSYLRYSTPCGVEEGN